MDKKLVMSEQISRLVDGDLDAEQLDALLRQMHEDEAAGQQVLANWDAYHQIGVALRSEESNLVMRPDFAARVAAQIALEPELAMPAAPQMQTVPETAPAALPVNKPVASWWQRQRTLLAALGGAAVTALAAMGLVGAPQLMVAVNDKAAVPGKSGNPEVRLASTVVSNNGNANANAKTSPSAVLAAGSQAASVERTERVIADGKPHEVVMLRDPQIDQYLLAHQRFSPSVYSTTQYARSATFASEKEK